MRKSKLSFSRRAGSEGRSSGRSLNEGGGGGTFLPACLPIERASVKGGFSGIECTGGCAKYPLCVAFGLGLGNAELTGGDDSPSPLLLGGVLKGDRSAASCEASGARLPWAAASTECDFWPILGLPARFTGGGTGGADDTGRSLFRGSFDGLVFAVAGKTGFESWPGVVPRLGILK